MVVLCTVLAAPLVVVLWSLVDPAGDVWRQMWETRLPGMIRDTLTLVAAVLTGTLVLGTGLAWLVTAYDFPLRRVVGWVLVAPLAMPGYVLGMVWLNTLSDPLGARGVRSIWVCAAVLTFTLYPYVYLFARAAFREQSGHAVAAARSLGCSPARAFWRVTLPTARPSLAAGAALVAMEVLTDIGTVRMFNVSTIADGVIRVWFDNGDRDAATEIAVLLVGAAVLLITAERLLRGRARYASTTGSLPTPPQRLSPLGSAGALLAAATVITVAIALPVRRLVLWAQEAERNDQTATVAGDLGYHLGNTVRIAGAATATCIVAGIALTMVVRRRGRPGRVLGRLCTIGYAVPGPVVAIGTVVLLTTLERHGLLPGGMLTVGTFAALIYALTVRFVAAGYQGTDSSMAKIPPQVVASARTLGARPWRVATRVELPLARAGVLAAAALIAVDTVKELPITLLLRPFGRDTLSVWVWQATSQSLWSQAALPSLAILAVGMVPVAVLLYALERGAEVVS